MRSLPKEQTIALEEHLLNREASIVREHQRKLALALAPLPVSVLFQDRLA